MEVACRQCQAGIGSGKEQEVGSGGLNVDELLALGICQNLLVDDARYHVTDSAWLTCEGNFCTGRTGRVLSPGSSMTLILPLRVTVRLKSQNPGSSNVPSLRAGANGFGSLGP